MIYNIYNFFYQKYNEIYLFIKDVYELPGNIKRLIKEHVRPYFGKMLLAAICMAIVAATTATNAWLMQPVLD